MNLAGRRLRTERADVWTTPLRPGDDTLLDRCDGPTLDVGCGPGRLVAALATRGRLALGIDVSAEAVRQARRRGAAVLHRCVFNAVPGERRWSHTLLADGNVGIGGDPVRLLDRCAQLLDGDGDILVETDPPGAPSWQHEVCLTDGTQMSRPFPWAVVALDELARHASAASLNVAESWTEAGRWFARLGK